VTAESPRVEEIRQIASRLDATIVEYLVTERRATAWVVTPSGGVLGVILPASPIEIAKLSDVRAQIEGTYRLSDSEDTHRALKALHRSLIAPVAKWLPTSPGHRIIIVPHGPLALVPFAALEDSRGAPLIERHTLSYVPSLSVSSFLARDDRADGTGALIVADPPPPRATKLPRLPASVQEGRRIATHLSELKPTLLSGPAATEAAVKQRSRSARLLHFATHGLVSETAPLTSSLVLAPGEGDDGFLRVDEVLWLDLNADLVVLSGCSTGAGKLSGDGILGLSRAFLFAGTPSLVVTQWDIADDPTMVLMDRFYAELQKGADKAQALRRAQLATRARFAHPAYWASFVLIGEP
jgi:CHAT domain-containing protein